MAAPVENRQFLPLSIQITESLCTDVTENNLPHSVQDQPALITADCLRVPIQYLPIERLEETRTKVNRTYQGEFYALAQNILQFPLSEQEKIYKKLKLRSKEQPKLEGLRETDSILSLRDLERALALYFQTLPPDEEENSLIQVASHLGINLIILRKSEDKIDVIQEIFYSDIRKEEQKDFPFFQSQLFLLISEQKDVFEKLSDGSIRIFFDSQNLARINEISFELAKIRESLLMAYRCKDFEELEIGPYQDWYKQYIESGDLNLKKALEDLEEIEDLQFFLEDLFVELLKEKPLAVILVQNEKYVIRPTKPDGACALHALLGEEKKNIYQFVTEEQDSGCEVKRLFTDKLREQLALDQQNIRNKFLEVIRFLIGATESDLSAQMIFKDSQDGRVLLQEWTQIKCRCNKDLKDLQEEEAILWLSLMDEDGPLLNQIMKEVEHVRKRGVTESLYYDKDKQDVLKILTANPTLILDFINADTSVFLNLFDKTSYQEIEELREKQRQAADEREKKEEELLTSSDLVYHYLITVNRSDYFLNTQEIHLAAYLFNKKVQMVAFQPPGDIVFTEALMNPECEEEVIVIYHEEKHFERCVLYREKLSSQIKPSFYFDGNYQAVDLRKLEQSASINYRILDCKRGLEEILCFIKNKEFYQQASPDLEKKYQLYLDEIKTYLGVKERWVIAEEGLSDKISLNIKHLNSLLPKGLKDNIGYILDPRFKKLIEVSNLLQQRDEVDRLAIQLSSETLSQRKTILRQSGKYKSLQKVQEIANQMKEKSVEEIKEILCLDLYEKKYSKFSEDGRRIAESREQKVKFDQEVTDQTQDPLLRVEEDFISHVEERGKDCNESSLDQIIDGYKVLNQIKNGFEQRLKAYIVNIRLYIENFKQGKHLLSDSSQTYPLVLIAEICVKMEKLFGDMMRDTQLLAILCMLGSENSRGVLAEVKTGEGKSYIIAAFAIIKIKQGYEVDVITSSATLARRDSDKFKDFYSEFGISCAHNCDQDKGMMAKACYKINSVVYGTAASFEGDSLRSEFYQSETFNGRARGIAIFDEADSALLDKSSWLCQISDSVAGMSTLRPILYCVWAFVIKKMKESEKTKIETKEQYNVFIEGIKQDVYLQIGVFFSGESKSFLIPEHLRDFAKYRIKYWIESALQAIIYSQDREYDACEILKKITPIDYANTGEWEGDVQWEDGLHQFLQIKTGMAVETETLTKSFMSNYTLAHKYKAVYGLSGTLGDEEEAEALKILYGLQVYKVPKFKISRYEEKPGWITNDHHDWLDSLYADVVLDGQQLDAPSKDQLPLSQNERLRSTLIICKTIADVKEIEEHFKKKGLSSSDIVTYTKGDEDKSKISQATKGKVIVATNLSGRGTDIDASSIEQVGGLHVIFSFLPGNRRIQDQGFGRTARKGLSGSSRLIIKTEELKSCHFKEVDGKRELTYDTIVEGRNQNEQARLHFLISEEKNSLQTKSRLFDELQKIVHSVSQNFSVEPELERIRANLLEVYKSYILDEWAIFLDRVSKDLEKPNIEAFYYARTLEKMAEKNDLYKMQYVNSRIDVNNKEVLEQANVFYKQRAEKKDLTAAFASYNRVFVLLTLNKRDIESARTCLKNAEEILEKGEEYEKSILRAQHELTLSQEEAKEAKSKMEGTALLRLILTMKFLVKNNLEQIDKLAHDYSKLKISFGNPSELQEKPESSQEAKKTEEGGYTIPEELMQEAIKLGLKGPLNIEGEGDSTLAIVLAVVCVLVAIAAVVAIVCLGPISGIVAGAVLGAAIGGAVNAIKGAVKGDFSLNNFGKDVLVGLVTGLVGGGIGAGLGAAAGAALKVAGTLTRVAIQASIGGVSGAAAGILGQVTRCGLDGTKVKADEVGKAALIGTAQGALSGGLGGIAPHGTQSIRWGVVSGSFGGLSGNLAGQGIQIAMGDQKSIDIGAVLESGSAGLIQGGAQAKGAKRIARAKLSPNIETSPSIYPTRVPLQPLQPIPSIPHAIDPAIQKNKGLIKQKNLKTFNQLEKTKFSRGPVSSTGKRNPIGLDLPRSRAKSVDWKVNRFPNPEIFPKGRAWDNTIPNLEVVNQPKKPRGAVFLNYHHAEKAALYDARCDGPPLTDIHVLFEKGHKDGRVKNSEGIIEESKTKIYKVSRPYKYNDVITDVVAIQTHTAHDGVDAPHVHVRPAWREGEAVVRVDENKNFPGWTVPKSSGKTHRFTYDHYFYKADSA